MQNRIAAAGGAALAVACLAACSSPPMPSPPAAGVTINGGNVLQTQAVGCSQLQWMWTIDIGNAASGARVTVDTSGPTPAATTVHINSLGGFTGTYSQGNGTADTKVSGKTFTVAGTANGFDTTSNLPASAQYRIVARC